MPPGIQLKRTPEEQFELLLNAVLDIKLEMAKISREMREKVDMEVEKNISGKIMTLESLGRRGIVLQELLIEQGILSRGKIKAKEQELNVIWKT
jgi:hypothetical protein